MALADKLPSHETSLAVRLRERSLEVIEDGFFYLSLKEHVFMQKKELLPRLLAKVNVLSALVSLVNERKYFQDGFAKELYEDINSFARNILQPSVPVPAGQEINDVLAQDKSYPSAPYRTAPGPAPYPVASEQPVVSSSQHHVTEESSGYPQPSAASQHFLSKQAVAPSAITDNKVQAQTVSYNATQAPSAHTASVVWKTGGIATKGWSFNEGLLPDRQRHIFILMREKRRSSLKEICQLFPGLSEKTIRNDLNVLCERGLIQRVGVAPRSYYITA